MDLHHALRFPLEIYLYIYQFCDIDTKQTLHRVFYHETFVLSRLHISSNAKKIIDDVNTHKHASMSVQNALHKYFNNFFSDENVL